MRKLSDSLLLPLVQCENYLFPIVAPGTVRNLYEAPLSLIKSEKYLKPLALLVIPVTENYLIEASLQRPDCCP